MKKVIATLLVLVLALGLVACGGKTEPEPVDEPAAETHSIIFFAIVLGDLSFNDAGYAGCKAVSEKYGWSFDAVELGNDTATYENAIADALDSGEYDVVVTQNGYGLGDLCLQYSELYPDVKFIYFDAARDADVSGHDNVYAIAFKTCEATFLAGAIAGKLSKTGTVGAFIYNDVPGGNDFVTGYVAGLQYANPDAKLYLAYGGGTAGPDVAYEVIGAMISGGADIVLGASGRAFSGMVQALTEAGGVEAGYYAFGPDTDMYASYSAGQNAQYADVILTSVLKNIENAVVYACDQWVEGTIEWGTVVNLGILEGGTGIADNEHYQATCPAEIKTYIDEIIEDVKSGELVIPSYYDFADYDAYVAWRDGTGIVTAY